MDVSKILEDERNRMKGGQVWTVNHIYT
jgi:hypothetical protein